MHTLFFRIFIILPTLFCLKSSHTHAGSFFGHPVGTLQKERIETTKKRMQSLQTDRNTESLGALATTDEKNLEGKIEADETKRVDDFNKKLKDTQEDRLSSDKETLENTLADS